MSADILCSACSEAWKEEALDDLPWKDERGPSSIRRTLEPFQRQRWGNFWEMGWSAYGLFQAHIYHLELNWTELLSTVSLKNQTYIKLCGLQDLKIQDTDSHVNILQRRHNCFVCGCLNIAFYSHCCICKRKFGSVEIIVWRFCLPDSFFYSV